MSYICPYSLRDISTFLNLNNLQNWKLDFVGFTDFWNGAPATIVPIQNATLLGTLWEIDLKNLPDIDEYLHLKTFNLNK